MKARRLIGHFLVSAVVLCLMSCKDPAARMAKGFRLPDGDPERGKTAFLELDCHQCHPVAGVTLPEPEGDRPVSYTLGGTVRKVKTYGELVTSIIQPQHIVSQNYINDLEKSQREGAASPMPSFNDRMSVSQMIDIVTFLHERYQTAPPPGTTYPQYLPVVPPTSRTMQY